MATVEAAGFGACQGPIKGVTNMATRTTRNGDDGHEGNGSVATLVERPEVAATDGAHDYVLPVVHLHVSERVVDVGFWAALATAAVMGVVDLPLAALIGGTVVVARRHAQR